MKRKSTLSFKKSRTLRAIICCISAACMLSSSASAIVVAPLDWTLYDYGYVDAPAGADLSGIEQNPTEIKVVVNNELVSFPDAKPFTDENNRTLIPVRFVSEAMGADVSWDQDTQTARIANDEIIVEITVGKKELRVTHGTETAVVTMDTKAINRDGRIFVPIRFVAEALGAYVDWSNLYNTVEIILSDVMTREEIQRLRSYPLFEKNNFAQNFKETLKTANGYKLHETFTGSSAFSNAHLFGWTNVDIQKLEHAQNDIAGLVVKNGRPSGDFAANMVRYAKDHIATEPYLSLIGKHMWQDDMSRAIYSRGMSGSARVCHFRSIDELAYREPWSLTNTLSMRGILDVTFYAPYPIQAITEDFGIEDPEYGKTYYIDADVQVSISAYGYMQCSGKHKLYRLNTPDGQPVRVSI